MMNYLKYIGILVFIIGIFYNPLTTLKLIGIILLLCFFVVRIIKIDRILSLKLNSLFYIINLLLTIAYLLFIHYNSIISLLIKIIFLIQFINLMIIYFKNDQASKNRINLYFEFLILSFLIFSQLYPLTI